MKKVFVSGCFDMLHSGHVAFLDEAAALGDLHVGVGADRTIALLKGRTPVNNEAERLYMIKALKAVKDAFVCSGTGMMDFADDVKALRPDIFFVNSDGASHEKEVFCRELGIEYRIGQREPHSGLPARSTTSYRAECRIPYRVDIAGGWLDQPLLSKLHPGPVITVSVEPDHEFFDLAGMATSTRKKAIELWNTQLPAGDDIKNARALFCYENPPGRNYVSGSQDALGMFLPGVNRLGYDGDFWPAEIEPCRDQRVLEWLEKHLYLVFICQRERGFDPYAGADLAPGKVKIFADAANRCWTAIRKMDYQAFASAFLESFEAQASLFPAAVTPEVERVIAAHRPNVDGWTLQGAGGGGYMAVVTRRPGPDMIKLRIRRNLF